MASRSTASTKSLPAARAIRVPSTATPTPSSENTSTKATAAFLKASFIGRVARDFRRIYGHARPGASQALNKSFGAHLGPVRKNWYGTGEDYRLYVLHLRNSAPV